MNNTITATPSKKSLKLKLFSGAFALLFALVFVIMPADPVHDFFVTLTPVAVLVIVSVAAFFWNSVKASFGKFMLASLPACAVISLARSFKGEVIDTRLRFTQFSIEAFSFEARIVLSDALFYFAGTLIALAICVLVYWAVRRSTRAKING